jgi:hypothetical protein
MRPGGVLRSDSALSRLAVEHLEWVFDPSGRWNPRLLGVMDLRLSIARRLWSGLPGSEVVFKSA